MTAASVVDAGIYLGILALLYLVLSVRQVRARVRHRAARTAASQAALERAEAAQSDFATSVPLALLLLLVCNLLGASPFAIHALGLLLLLARAVHAIGVSRNGPASTAGFAGITLTWLAILGAAALAILGCLHTLLAL